VTITEIDADPLHAAGTMLYDSPLLAERLAAFGHVLARSPEAVDPSVLRIVLGADAWSASDAFAALARLHELRAAANTIWERVDTIVVPTITRHPSIAEVLDDPIGPNRLLGTYTSFVSPLGWSALAVPAGQRDSGLPFGISMIGPAGADAALLELGARFGGEPARVPRPAGYDLAVVGAHLSGQPLNHELVDRGGLLVTTTVTASEYRLFALGTTPPKPGLVRDRSRGAPIEVEVWRLAPAAFGSFVAGVPRPLAIGTIELADGNEVSGFVCEPEAIAGAGEITAFGGWRAWRSNGAPASGP
jgi:allophanate hydrolase